MSTRTTTKPARPASTKKVTAAGTGELHQMAGRTPELTATQETMLDLAADVILNGSGGPALTNVVVGLLQHEHRRSYERLSAPAVIHAQRREYVERWTDERVADVVTGHRLRAKMPQQSATDQQATTVQKMRANLRNALIDRFKI